VLQKPEQAPKCGSNEEEKKRATRKLVKEKDKNMEKNEVYLRIFKGIKKMGGRNTELVC
jgi:hypothetical protein